MKLKDNLVSTAFELFLKYGIKSVSMDDISRKLGISKKTIYSVVNTKEELTHFTFIERTIYANLQRGQKEGLYRQDFDPMIISKLYVLKSTSIADQDKFPAEAFDRLTLFKEMVRYHLRGIVSEKGAKLFDLQHKNILYL
jgi:AcrR family transcriptional regulator